MISILAAMMASAVSCDPVSGADRLWRPTIRWVIAGEVHGTNEAPDAFANLVCLAAATKRPVTVALEYPADDQAVIDAYLASNGDAKARSALLTSPVFASRTQDGRGSVAFVRLFDQLRHMRQAGQIEGVVASDTGPAIPIRLTRDAAMARAWTAVPAARNGIVLILVGNLHAMRKPVVTPTHTIITAGSLMPVGRTVTINITGSGGQAWNCQQDGCGAHAIGPPHKGVTKISYSTDEARRWDATYELGVPTTAASPALIVE